MGRERGEGGGEDREGERERERERQTDREKEMTNSLLWGVMNKHGSAYSHSALTRKGTKLYIPIEKDNNTKTLSTRYSEYGERGRKGGWVGREKGVSSWPKSVRLVVSK